MPMACSASLAASSDVEARTDGLFGFSGPLRVPGVDARLLDPRSTWRDPSAYDTNARERAQRFADNFAARVGDVDAHVRAAGPRG